MLISHHVDKAKLSVRCLLKHVQRPSAHVCINLDTFEKGRPNGSTQMRCALVHLRSEEQRLRMLMRITPAPKSDPLPPASCTIVVYKLRSCVRPLCIHQASQRAEESVTQTNTQRADLCGNCLRVHDISGRPNFVMCARRMRTQCIYPSAGLPQPDRIYTAACSTDLWLRSRRYTLRLPLSVVRSPGALQELYLRRCIFAMARPTGWLVGVHSLASYAAQTETSSQIGYTRA